MKHFIQTDIKRSDLDLPLDRNEEVWLEFGWTTDNPRGAQNMLWYNEGNLSEIGYWTRNLCAKILTDEPKGEMYFLMRSRDVEHRIIVG